MQLRRQLDTLPGSMYFKPQNPQPTSQISSLSSFLLSRHGFLALPFSPNPKSRTFAYHPNPRFPGISPPISVPAFAINGPFSERPMSRYGNQREDFFSIGANEGNRRVANPGTSSKRTRVYASRRAVADGLFGILGVGSLDVLKPQDTDYAHNSYVAPLSDDIVLLILARVPRSEQAKLGLLNKRYLGLVRSGELYKIRGEIGAQEPLVFVFAGGDHWWAIDPQNWCCWMLPILPADPCFGFGDKETLCVGTHLLVTGRMVEGMVTWRYELTMNQWFKGPSMITPRCLFASASCGDFACVAGGVMVGTNADVLNSAEKYNPERKTWEVLPRMNRCRKLCSGCFLDRKFYVIGGVDKNNKGLTCGEFYDVKKNSWVLVPDMISAPSSSSGSPPLVAVANNELYLLDVLTNQLKVYLKGSNSWKVMGDAPVKADMNRGWGVAFKSLGDKLLVIGGAHNVKVGCWMMMMFTCHPDPGGNGLCWEHVETSSNYLSTFIHNCAVMIA